MATATALQQHLLKGIQNLARDNEQYRPPPAPEAGSAEDTAELWGIGQRSLTQLEQVALAVGVPKPWVDYARAAGQRGVRWQPGQAMLGSGLVEREQLVSALGREIRGLQDMAGVGAVYIGQGGLDGDVVARFRRVTGMTWQRLGAISHALGLSTEEQHQVWTRGDRHWSTVVRNQLRDADLKVVAQQWNRIVATDFSAATIPVVVLQAAGITAEDTAAAMPISPDRMVAQVAEAFAAEHAPTTADQPLHDAATAIETALTADGDTTYLAYEHQDFANSDPAIAVVATDSNQGVER
jgi:hypothetical protein